MRNRDGFTEPIFKANRAGLPPASSGNCSTFEVCAVRENNLVRCLPTESGRQGAFPDSTLNALARFSSGEPLDTGKTMSKRSSQNGTAHRRQRKARRHVHPQRRQSWNGLSPAEILKRYPPSKTSPLKVLEILISLFNTQHTATQKTVSFKTRQERADFLRRFFRDLEHKTEFKTLPDPRNLGDCHIRAMVGVWQREGLAPATIQTYLSFLRGLALWIGKPGFIRKPAFYGLTREEDERHETAEEDKSWSAHGIDIDALIADICRYDPYVGASMRLIRALGLRRKEALMFRPHSCVVPFEATGLPLDKRKADQYAAILAGGKGGRPRYIPLDTSVRIEAVSQAQSLVADRNAHMGRPGDSLKQSLKHFMYVMGKFGITKSVLGVTARGLRHEALIERFEEITGQSPPVRDGERLPGDIDKAARSEVAAMAGHVRRRASSAYLGAVLQKRRETKEGGWEE